MEITYDDYGDEPLTQEQWDRVIALVRLTKAVAEWHETTLNPHFQRAVKASFDFQNGLKQIQANAGLASESLGALHDAILDMANQEQ